MSNRDALSAFKVSAESYIALVDAAESAERTELFLDLASALSGIYAAALELPETEPSSTDPEADGLVPEDRPGALKRMEDMLGADDWYWTVAPFLKEDAPELLTGSLADDLMDVYHDLRDGLDHLRAGWPETDVIWEWRFTFWSHWGEHAVNALQIIHARLAVEGHGR